MVSPQQFNNETALYEAMRIFWTKGYDGTSLLDLLLCMKVSRSSLYNSYQDKRVLELFFFFPSLGRIARRMFLTNVATSLETADEHTRVRINESLKSLENVFYEVLL